MSADETFLESFVESISTHPSEIKRNLELMKKLDESGLDICERLREAEDKYTHETGEKILSLPVAKRRRLDSGNDGPKAKQRYNFWNDPDEGVVVRRSPGNEHLLIPTTEELRVQIQDDEVLHKIAKFRKSLREQADEKVAVAEQTFAIVDAALKRLDTDLEKFEVLLIGTGQFEVEVVGGSPDDLAAVQVTPNSPDWILAKVISHDSRTGMYKLSDEDIESNKVYTLPESQVVILGGVDRLTKGDMIYAVYPDTTSFYQATVVLAPRKVSGGESFVMVHFKDDGDENGITHDKAVLMKHVMRVPYGAIQ
mmetsp:Transcript_21850/g.30680  ORF Transcript_21850/g.30680 Transcript_21850/m.30680 type:complete len:310 (+) Transcript_21850:104-1033(+)|eukprot:CAMPEP_0184865138 /NCGR_PEP_ID=MMETSP0580-20130426/17084_1 /TAXON_ID=1118495 /ORGANISM="Dactyliosolen fragilissimus" /LENGTH=309 /DNA_ID=CAMNT_0027364213 /DNA_START=54 /DNA_END=983 /DNA_ORIENTATION=+